MEQLQPMPILHQARTVYRAELSEEAQQASVYDQGTRGETRSSHDGQTSSARFACPRITGVSFGTEPAA